MNTSHSKAEYMPAPDQSVRNTNLPLATRRPSIHAIEQVAPGKEAIAHPCDWLMGAPISSCFSFHHRRRQEDNGVQSASFAIFQTERAAMRIENLADDRQAKPAASEIAVA